MSERQSNQSRCQRARSSNGKFKLIFDTEASARQYAEDHPNDEGQHAYICARGSSLHWHLTASDRPDIPGLKRGKFGRRGGSQHRGKRGLTRRPQSG